MLKIERQVVLEAHCVCDHACLCIGSTRKECFAKAAELGWQIKIHRKGEPTVICPECINRALSEKSQRKDAKTALRKARDAAVAKCNDELAKMNGCAAVVEEEA